MIKKLILSAYCFILTLNCYSKSVQDYQIQIQGNQRISSSVIEAISLQNNFEINNRGLNKLIKKLYKTGLFSNITIDVKQNILVINVKENPVVNDIVSRGSSKIDLKKIGNMLSLKIGRAYSKEALKSDLEQLIASYQKIGYRDVIINPYVNFLERNRVDVIFDIKLGKKHVINNIYIHNNHKISNRQIKKVLKSKEGVLWNNTFEAETLDVDKENVENFYTSRGFKDAKVEKIEVIRNAHKYDIHYYISENKLFKLNTINYTYYVDANLQAEIENFIKKEKTLKKGDIFNEQFIKNNIAKIENYLANKNLPSIKITYTTIEKNNTVDINFTISKSEMIYINDVIIKGNRTIPDKVIRIEVLFATGDVYNKKKIEQTKQRLNISGYFQTVNIEEIKLPNNMIDIVINVKETNTLNLGFSIGYTNLFGLMGEFRAQKKALFNEWYDGGFTFSRSGWQEMYAINLYNRHFKGTDLGVGFDLFSSKFGSGLGGSIGGGTFGSSIGYLNSISRETLGFTARTGYRITENVTQSLFTTIKNTDASVAGAFSAKNQILGSQYTSYSTHMVGHSLSYDVRDNSFIPTKGYAASIKQFVAGGLGIGSQQFTGNEINFSYYKPFLNEALVFNFSLTGGMLNNFGKEPIGFDNRYMLGYYNLRGFGFFGAGPTIQTENADGSTQNLGFSIGGNQYFSGTFDLSFPISGGESPLRGSFFFDFGTLTGVDGKQTVVRADGATERILDSGMIRTAVGFGIAWHSPMGALRFDFAEALQHEAYDRTMGFMIRFGNASGF